MEYPSDREMFRFLKYHKYNAHDIQIYAEQECITNNDALKRLWRHEQEMIRRQESMFTREDLDIVTPQAIKPGQGDLF